MADRPIIFSGPMVRALLDGRKTQTRRILKPQPPRTEDFPGAVFGLSPAVADGIKMYSLNDYGRLPKHPTKWDLTGSVGRARDAGFPLEYNTRYAVGDRLWVRECWSDQDCCEGEAMYRATACRDGLLPEEKAETRWRPSIHMPRWASRLTLVVEAVKVERLQDISEADALAEGCPAQTPEELAGMEARGWFRDIWDSLHGSKPGEAWAENPWIVALTFSAHRCNIDAMPAREMETTDAR